MIDDPEYDRYQDGSFFGNYYTTSDKNDNQKEEDNE
jgi:hypothetical protein